MKKILALLLVFLSMGLMAQERDYSQVLRDIDEWENFQGVDLSFSWNIISTRAGSDPVRHRLRIFRRDREEQSLWVMVEPQAQRGQATLISQDNIWYYDPESRQTVHESLRSDIGDLDIRNEDIQAPSYSRDYRIVSVEESTLGEHPVAILTLEAQNDSVSFPTVKLWVTQAQSLVLKEEEYSLSGRLMRTTQYGLYQEIDNKRVPTKILFVDELNDGQRTLAQAEDISIQDLDDHIFTRAFLENLAQ